MIRWIRRLEPLARRVLIIGLAVLALAIFGGVRSCQMAQTAKTEAKLSKGQTDAALASGKDAVETAGQTQANDAATDTITRENDRAIRQAPGAHAPVDPAAHNAGLRSVCRRAANRGKPECLQQPAAQ